MKETCYNCQAAIEDPKDFGMLLITPKARIVVCKKCYSSLVKKWLGAPMVKLFMGKNLDSIKEIL